MTMREAALALCIDAMEDRDEREVQRVPFQFDEDDLR